jgi:hypothetical protein
MTNATNVLSTLAIRRYAKNGKMFLEQMLLGQKTSEKMHKEDLFK